MTKPKKKNEPKTKFPVNCAHERDMLLSYTYFTLYHCCCSCSVFFFLPVVFIIILILSYAFHNCFTLAHNHTRTHRGRVPDEIVQYMYIHCTYIYKKHMKKKENIVSQKSQQINEI